jgi:hypothetical protein
MDLGRLDEVDGVTGAGLDQAAEPRLRVQVEVLDVVADVGLHDHPGIEPVPEGTLDGVAVLALLEHRRDRCHALAAAVDELGPQVRALEGLEQLEVQRADVDLGTAERVVHPLASQLRRVVDWQHMVEDLPGRPAECAVVQVHRRVEVPDGERDQGDRLAQTCHAGRERVRWGRHRRLLVPPASPGFWKDPDWAVNLMAYWLDDATVRSAHACRLSGPGTRIEMSSSAASSC